MVRYPRRAPVECLPHQHTNILLLYCCPCLWQISDYAAGQEPTAVPVIIIIIGAVEDIGEGYDTWVVTENLGAVGWWSRKSNLYYLPCLSLYTSKCYRNEIPEVHHFDRLFIRTEKVKRMCDATTSRMDGNGKWKAISVSFLAADVSSTSIHSTPQPCRKVWNDLLLYLVHVFMSFLSFLYISGWCVYYACLLHVVISFSLGSFSAPYFFMLLLLLLCINYVYNRQRRRTEVASFIHVPCGSRGFLPGQTTKVVSYVGKKYMYPLMNSTLCVQQMWWGEIPNVREV